MGFEIGFFPISIIDIIDIFIVSVIFYGIYLRIKDTRAMQLIIGLLILVGASIIAAWANLQALAALIQFFKSIWLIAIVVIFAPELRRLLIQIGSWRTFALISRQTEQHSIDEIVTAARVLSEKKIGALIVITRETQLGIVVDSGTSINSEVSYQLLLTIFTPNSPLHDLAVVIRGDRIVAANCLLPLSESQKIDRNLSSRHRAALGITEETDAISVIVSEETSAISLAVEGRLIQNLSPAELRANLISLIS
ncbi:diadenylate cyclase CdaA [Candidatus Latescibacterota bacterium]